MQKRNHSREFKLEVVRQVATGQRRPAQVCREYGLADSVLSRWRKEYHERGEAQRISRARRSGISASAIRGSDHSGPTDC